MATSKTYEITIIYIGAITLCPPLPKKAGNKDAEVISKLWAVMPKTEGSHVPVIFTTMNSTGRTQNTSHGKYGIWFIDGERVEFQTIGNGKLLYKHGAGASTKELDDMKAAPHLRDVSSQFVMKKGALDPQSKIVAAQVILPDATLRAGSHRKAEKKGIEVVFNPPARGTSTKKRVIMPQVRATIRTGPSVTAVATRLPSGADPTLLSFDAAKGGEIWVGHVDKGTLGALIDEIDGGPPVQVPGSSDRDFRYHYRVLDGAADVQIPWLTGYRSMGGERKCYVAMAEPPV